MSTTATSKGIFDSANAEARDSVVELLSRPTGWRSRR